MMKKHVIALLVLTVTLVSWNAFAPQEASAATRWPRTLLVTYCWQIAYNPACPQQDVVLERNGRDDGTASVTIAGMGTTTGTWTYDRRSNLFVMDFPNMGVTYSGTKQGNCYVNGAITGPQFGGSWEGCFID